MEKFLELFTPQSTSTLIPCFWQRRREQKSEGERKARGNMVKGEDEKEGTLETAVGEVS